MLSSERAVVRGRKIACFRWNRTAGCAAAVEIVIACPTLVV